MKKETLKYYLSTFIMAAIFMIAMSFVSHTQGTYLFTSEMTFDGSLGETFAYFLNNEITLTVGNYMFDVIIVVVFPFVFTGIFALIELLSKLLRSKKKKQEEAEAESYQEFIDKISGDLSLTHKFNVEDFRHFRENKKFQETLKKLYLIFKDGESENNTYVQILRKFDKNTKEREATEYLVSFTIKMAKAKDAVETKEEKTNE